MAVKIMAYGGSTYEDITDDIAFQGLKWSLSDIESSDAGRTQDTKMHRGKLGDKVRLDVTLMPVTTERASTILTIIKNEWLSVQYLDPQTGTTQTKKMYSNNRPASYMLNKGTTVLWDGITFPLIEE